LGVALLFQIQLIDSEANDSGNWDDAGLFGLRCAFLWQCASASSMGVGALFGVEDNYPPQISISIKGELYKGFLLAAA
jgi:hypothetical protein